MNALRLFLPSLRMMLPGDHASSLKPTPLEAAGKFSPLNDSKTISKS